MRFHLPALPGQPVTRENSVCAFTQKLIGFKRIMEGLGHDVTIYGGETADVQVWTDPIAPPPFRPEAWQPYNVKVIEAIEPGDRDVLGLVGGGSCSRLISEHLPDLIPVEFGIGYGGSWAPFRVWESYAWMHQVYGQEMGSTSADGRFFDAVIPGYIDPDEFEIGQPGDYVLYLGRMIRRKGVHVAAQAAEAAGVKLIMAGEGPDIPGYGEHVGRVSPDERRELLKGARALLAPTLYIEPFGNVVVEAQMAGVTPITTDWGAFTETNTLGFRCRTLGEFVDAIRRADTIDPQRLRDHAITHYSFEVAAHRYDMYFKRLELIHDAGWESLEVPTARQVTLGAPQ